MAVLKAVPVRWVQIQSPDTRYDHQWSLDALLTKEQAKKLAADAKKVHTKGIKIKKDDDGQLFYKFSRKVQKSDGSGENSQPVCIDGHKTPLTCLIGNGSVCNIQYNIFDWKNKFGEGAGIDFMGIQVLDLVSFGGSDGDEFEDEGGSEGGDGDEFSSTSDTTPDDSDSYDDDDFS